MTDYQAEMPVLYHNLGQGFFEDVALKAGVTTPLMPHVKWGCSFLDVDNDGDRDLYVGNGHLEPMIHQIDSTTDYRVANVLFRNDGDGTFVDISAQSGSGLAVVECHTRRVCRRPRQRRRPGPGHAQPGSPSRPCCKTPRRRPDTGWRFA